MAPPDPRSTPINERVVAAHLGASPGDQKPVTGAAGRVSVPVADLLRCPRGPRDRQLLMGDVVIVYEVHEGWCFAQAKKDGYVGYLPEAQVTMGPDRATHLVTAPATHAYATADFKSQDLHALSFGSRVEVIGQETRFAETNLGHIPLPHLQKLGKLCAEPVDVAVQFLGTPYLWGGNSRWGIDCSGLVQAACLSCGIPCPGDSDQQETQLGQECRSGSAYRRGDLLFWKGHVAMVVDAQTLIHANAFHMAVAYEDIEQAIARIAAQGDGPVTKHRRLPA